MATASETQLTTESLLQMLLKHQGNAGEFFDFMRQNKTQLADAFEYMGMYADGMKKLLDDTQTPDARAKAMAQLSDASSKAAFTFLANHPKESGAMLDFLKNHFMQVSTGVKLLGENAPELEQIVQFVSAHPEEAANLADRLVSGKGGLNTSLLKNIPFAMSHPQETYTILQFASRHRDDLSFITSGSPEEGKQLKSMTDFLLNSGQLRTLAQGMSGIKRGLGETIALKQQQAEDAGKDQQLLDYEGLLAKDMARTGAESLKAVREKEPEVFKRFSELECEAIAMARNGEPPRAAVDAWEHQYDKLDAGRDPQHRLPFLSPILLYNFPQAIDVIEPSLAPGAGCAPQARSGPATAKK